MPGAIYLVTARSDNGEPVFPATEDREEFLAIFGQVIRRTGWHCHAWCLMDDHYLLLIETPKPNLSKGMRQLNGVYTQRHNQRHGSEGHVFQGRYKAVLVDRKLYKEVLRHVLQAPMRERRAKKLERWTWSSYPATMGLKAAPEWLATKAVLAAFGSQPARARKALAAYLAKLPDEDLAGMIRHQIYLGDANFVAAVQRRAAPPKRGARRPPAKPAKPLKDFARAHKDPKLAMAKAYLAGAYPMSRIARHFGVHYSTVSRAVKAYEER